MKSYWLTDFLEFGIWALCMVFSFHHSYWVLPSHHSYWVWRRKMYFNTYHIIFWLDPVLRSSNGTTSSILLDIGGFKTIYVILVALKSFNRWYQVIVNCGTNVSAVIIHWIPAVGLLSNGFLIRDQSKVTLLHNYNQATGNY